MEQIMEPKGPQLRLNDVSQQLSKVFHQAGTTGAPIGLGENNECLLAQFCGRLASGPQVLPNAFRCKLMLHKAC